jgi:hypothetical protein
MNEVSSRQNKNKTYTTYNSKSIKKGKDKRAHRSPRLLPELERRVDSTLNSRQGFTCTSITKLEPLQVENYKYSVVCWIPLTRGVFLGVPGAVTNLIKSVICQVLAGRPSHMAGRASSTASTDSRPQVPFHRLLGGCKVGSASQGVWPADHPLGPHVSGLCTRRPHVRCIPGVTLILVEFLISL